MNGNCISTGRRRTQSRLVSTRWIDGSGRVNSKSPVCSLGRTWQSRIESRPPGRNGRDSVGLSEVLGNLPQPPWASISPRIAGLGQCPAESAGARAVPGGSAQGHTAHRSGLPAEGRLPAAVRLPLSDAIQRASQTRVPARDVLESQVNVEVGKDAAQSPVPSAELVPH